MVEAISYIVSLFLVATLVYRWQAESSRHHQQLEELDIRIHVNGIRGKSTVTRMIAGMLREAGINTAAKTTGTAAVFIDSGGVDVPLRRRGAPTILEQIDLIRERIEPRCKALVTECMAIRPNLQEVSETRLVDSQIGVITNIRIDHQDVMGETLPEIARSLLNTCPRYGVLVASEQDPQLLEILKIGAEQRNSRLIVAQPELVTEKDMARFDYDTFRENVAVGLAIASVLGISRDTAIRGMANSSPDPGALTIRNTVINDKLVTWANLFAVNDRESAIYLFDLLAKYRTADTTTVVILNNRLDRELRALLFADIAVFDLAPDRIAAVGYYVKSVTDRLITDGYPPGQIINIETKQDRQARETINALLSEAPTPHVLLIGFANVHTRQAEGLAEFFDTLPQSAAFDSVCIDTDSDLNPPEAQERQLQDGPHC